MKLEPYIDLVKSNVDVLTMNLEMTLQTIEDDNQRLVDRVFILEKDNMRLLTENKMMVEENNRLRSEYIKVLDMLNKLGKQEEPTNNWNHDCRGCKWNDYEAPCPTEDCPDCGCCREHFEAIESEISGDTNED